MGNGRPPLLSLSAALIALLGGAGPTGMLVPDAIAQVAKRPDDENDSAPLLVVAPGNDRAEYLAHESHRSHSSHASHASHYSGGGGGGGGGGGYYTAPDPAPPPPPPPPKPARISLIAYPGGRIFVDGQLMGRDTTGTLTLKAGTHTVRIENRFLGTETRTIEVSEGDTGIFEIVW